MVEVNQTMAVEAEFSEMKNTFDDEFAHEEVAGPARAATSVTTVTTTTVTVVD